MSTRLPISVLRSPVHLLATGFGSGLAPWAPGTFGSAFALLPCWWVMAWAWPYQLAVALAVFCIGVWVCGESAKRLGVHDHPGIVLDEIAAMLALMPVVAGSWIWLLVAFGLFRFFDIVKPWPIRDMDHRLKGGLGIMLDDQMAAVYAAICLSVFQHGFATT